LDDLRKEHVFRFANQIPPGYKDAGKADEGIGDYLIWETILEIGRTRKASVIFVTGGEKVGLVAQQQEASAVSTIRVSG
jgi:hypothetical protein